MIRLRGAAFERCWQRSMVLVEEGNRRHSGHSETGQADAQAWPELAASGRLYVKRQQGFFCHPLWNLGLPTPTLRRELRMLRKARAAAVSVPDILAYGEANHGRALLVLAAIEHAHDLDAALTDPLRDRTRICSAVGRALAQLHRARIRHGALYPKHILIGGDAEPAGNDARVWLIDFEKAQRRLTAHSAARIDFLQFLRRAPTLTAADRAVIADAYAAAGLGATARRLNAPD